MKFSKAMVAASLFVLSGFAHAQAPSAAQVRSWAAACANCHGTNGQAQPGMESLAGVNKDDIVKKMQDFIQRLMRIYFIARCTHKQI